MNKYLITGGNGFIGSNLALYIRNECPDAKIITVGYGEPLRPLGNCEDIVCDVGNTKEYERHLDEDTSVIHLAWRGFPNIKKNNIHVFDGIHSNVAVSCRLFEAAISRKCKSIVFLSSGGGIYGKPLTIPIKETHPTTPLSYYGVEKLAVENYLRLMACSSSTNAVILRPANPYGRFQKPFTGQGVIATFLASALMNRPVEVWGDGNAVRDYFYIHDLSSAIIKSVSSDRKYIVANIGSGTGTSINEIIRTIEKVTGAPLSVRYAEATSAETGANILDCTASKNLFGWKAEYSLEDGIKEMMSAWNAATGQFDGRWES